MDDMPGIFFRPRVNTNPPSTNRVIRRDLSSDSVNQPWPGVCWDRPECKKWLNARANAVPLLHGLVTYDEVKSGVIDHALAMSHGGTERGSSFFLGGNPTVYPCNSKGNNSGIHDHRWSPWLGHRFQLDPSIDIDSLGLAKGEKVIAKALQEYGMIYVENSGTFNNDIYLEELTFRSY